LNFAKLEIVFDQINFLSATNHIYQKIWLLIYFSLRFPKLILGFENKIFFKVVQEYERAVVFRLGRLRSGNLTQFIIYELFKSLLQMKIENTIYLLVNSFL